MLLGCCHCGETPSESTPPSESSHPPSESVPSISEEPISERPLVCGDCDAVPYRWKVTLAGWTFFPGKPTHATCCQARNGAYVLSAHTGAFGFNINGLGYASFCRIWKTAELAKNHAASPPSCANVAGTPLIAMGLRGLGPTVTVIDLSVYTPAGFTGLFHSFSVQGSGQCFYSGSLAYSSGGSSIIQQCSHGTVTVEPA